MNMYQKLVAKAGVAALAAAFVVGAASDANAAMKLLLWDPIMGGTPLTAGVIVVDDGPGDAAFLVPGMIVYSGAVGPRWPINVTTGLSKPILGSATSPHMDLNSVDVSWGFAPAALFIALTDTHFLSPLAPLGMEIGIGGTTPGAVVYGAGADPGNDAFCEDFGCSETLGPLGFLGPGAFSAEEDGTVGPHPGSADEFYSLTQWVLIVHDAGDYVTSFNADLHGDGDSVPVPEPASLSLLGLGLAGVAAVSRRRQSRG